VLKTALTPIINMLSIAGLISIPGMMTGQILAGGDAIVAAKYQVCGCMSIVD
jgi:putative ABC transport system permease protein